MLATRSLVNIFPRVLTCQALWKQNYLSSLWAPIQQIKRSKSFSTKLSPEDAFQANWEGRVDLAAAFRGLEMFNLHEGICNHLSLLVPAANGDGIVMLMNPYGHHWKEIKPEYLVGINDQGEMVEGEGEVEISASTIHRGIHNTRADAKCVFHVHSPYTTALGMLKDLPFGMYHQTSTYFYKDFAYDRDYSGLSLDVDEGERCSKHLGGDKHVLFMCNHGVMVIGPSVADVFNDVYYLERACMYQVLAMSTGRELCPIPDDVCKTNKRNWDTFKTGYSVPFFESIKRLVRLKN